MRKLFFIVSLLYVSVSITAQVLHDSLRIYYKQNSVKIDTLYMQDGESPASFIERNRLRLDNPSFTLQKISIIGSASPEGRRTYNESLAIQRARSLEEYIKQNFSLDDGCVEVTSVGVDWARLTDMVIEAVHMPNQKEVLQILQGGYLHNERLRRLKQENRSIPYRWMYKHLFPSLRQAKVIVFYDVKKEVIPSVEEEPVTEPVMETKEEPAVVEPDFPVTPVPEKNSFVWALKTNALYDVVLVPNVGVEVYAGKQWSVAANWMYAWWSNNSNHKFWRIYGGDVEVRHWLDRKAEKAPLQGHHIGAYAQLLTYDFEFGGRGYLGDKWSYAFGLSYGYSLPIARLLNLDFSIGIGYLGGKYEEYIPIEGHYVWQATKNRNWIGPTKAEVSLVWFPEFLNKGKTKGGKQ